MRIPLHILISCVFLHSSCHQSKEEFVYDRPVRTIVAGKILNPVSEIRTTGLAVSRIGFGQEEFELLIDTTGVFTFEFETYIPTDIWLTYQTNFLLLLHPGDSLYVEFDGSKQDRPETLETIFISGDRVSTNQQITSFQKAYFESSFCGNCGNWEIKESAIQNLEPKEFRRFADSLKTARENFLLTFSQNHTLNDESHSWAKAFLDESYFHDLTYYPDSHRKSKALKRSEWDVPIGYYDYFKFHSPAKESLQNGNAILGFSNKYLFRFIRIRVHKLLAEVPAHETMENLTDSLFIQTIKKNTSDPLLKEILITYYFSNLLEQSEVESFERNIQRIQSEITAPFLKEPLFKLFEETRLAIENGASSPNVIASNPALKSKGSLIGKIASEHTGKPIFVDVWATWCGPCLEEFPYANRLQDELPEVTFVYLCIESDKNRFQNTIKRFQLGGNHYFLNSTESKQLKTELSIDGIPHYILIDKDGVVINDGGELRPSEDGTKDKMQKLLSIQQ